MKVDEKKLNKAQKEAVEYFDSPLLIVAGAGTGKTTVITEKIRYLIEKKGVSPDNILALTFTEKSAREMEDRVESLFEFGFGNFHISTFHAFCQDILEQYGLDIGVPNQFKVLTETDTWMLMQKHLLEFNLDYYRPLGNPTRHIHELIHHFSKCKDEMISPEAYLDYAEHIELEKDVLELGEKNKFSEIANAYHTYNQMLLDNLSLDFGDLIFFTNKLLNERPGIKKKIHEKFKYILVDEFQDVNYAQYSLTKFLAEGAHITVVGDDDQSIYAFRGASVSNILRFQDDFKNTKHVVLTENYRSSQKILDTAYKLIQQNNPDRLEIKLNLDKKLIANGLSGEGTNEADVLYLSAKNLDEEVQLVIQQIEALKKQDSTASWDDFAILVRANSHAEPFLRGLQHVGIPYEFFATQGLLKQKMVITAMSILKAIMSHEDSVSLYRILSLDWIEIFHADLQKITDFAKRKTVSYYQALQQGAEFHISQDGLGKVNKILHLLHVHSQKARSEKPSKILYSFLEESGYFRTVVHKESLGEVDALHEIYQIREFFDFLARYEEEHPEAHISEFLEYQNFLLESGDEGNFIQVHDNPDSVNVLTIHGSKGLEFRYVFVVNLVEDRFPTRHRGGGIEIPSSLIKEQLPDGDYHIQEERRLFYVAITRAKKQVYFTSAKNYGGVREKKVSRFLIELGYEKKSESINKIKDASFLSEFSLAKNNNFSLHTTEEYPLPKSFSFSQLQTYGACPYRYKLAHVIKIPTRGNASFSFGTSMHSTLQKFYEQVKALNAQKQSNLFDSGIQTTEDNKNHIFEKVKVPSFADLLKFYEQSFIKDWYRDTHQREEYFKKGKNILKTFYNANQEQWNIPLALETSFQVQVGNFTLKGRIDRIDRLDDDTLEIIDYKTGQSKETLSTEDRQQLFLYQIVTQKSYAYKNLGTVSKLTFYYLNDNIKTSFFGKEKELESFQEKIIDTMNKIYSKNFQPTPSIGVCGHCDFRDICEYRIL